MGGYNLILKCAFLLAYFLLSMAFFSCAGGAGGSGGGTEGTSLSIRTDNGAKTLYEKDEIVSFSVTISSGSYTASKTANKGETTLFSDIPAVLKKKPDFHSKKSGFSVCCFIIQL